MGIRKATDSASSLAVEPAQLASKCLECLSTQVRAPNLKPSASVHPPWKPLYLLKPLCTPLKHTQAVVLRVL